jgi:hypothetical protein
MILSKRTHTLWMGALLALTVGCHESTAVAPAAGDFTVVPSPDTASGGGTIECTSANECTTGDQKPCDRAECIAGKCVISLKEPGQSCVDAALTPGECKSTRCDSAGACVVAGAHDGTRCGVLDSCVQNTCKEGACNGPTLQRECEDDNPCTTDGCDPATGCVFTVSTAACDDGNSCTSGDSCKTGTCAGTPSCECYSDAECVVLDTDVCDGTSTCVEGKCVNDAKTAITCELPVGAPQCDVAVCDPATGTCTTASEEYKSCDDGNACTTEDYCTKAGACISKKVLCEFNCDDTKDDDGDTKFDCDDTDCATDSLCVPPEPSCTDDVKNGTETDKNCGGTCPKCALDQVCAINADCASDFCGEGKCAEVPVDPCANSTLDVGETDVDCGGPGTCARCIDTKACLVATDCASNFCDATNHCGPEPVDPCANSTLDVGETDVDCGGPGTCARCIDTKACLVATDCASNFCDATNHCGPEPVDLCANSTLDVGETDVDCGGPTCDKCANTFKCTANSDCTSAYCSPVFHCDVAP